MGRSWLAILLLAGMVQLQAATFTVDNAGSQDDGDALAPGMDDSICDIDPLNSGQHCTLRAAIQEANDTPGSDTIVFASAITSITLTVGLPTATTPMIIDGLNAAAVGGRVDINGGNTIDAFDFNAGAQGSTLKNLVIRNFNDDGVAITGHGYTIDNNLIGVNPLGLSASKNTGDGISITGVAGPPANIPSLGLPSDLTNVATITADLILAFATIPPNHITGNLISGNDGDGIEIFSENAAVNIVSGNRIGTNLVGLLAIPNGTGGGDGHGVLINSFAYANVIGPGNLISGNNSDPNSHGIALVPGAVRYPNFISGNTIGPSSAILTGLGNSVDGIFVNTSPQTAAAPNNPTNYAAFIGPGNIIGYNGDSANVPTADNNNGAVSGIQISSPSARVRVFGNFIGIGEDPMSAGSYVNIGNNGDGINISASDHEIGGFLPLEANFISSNKRHGIALRGNSTNTVKIIGNTVGRDPSNTVNQSNDQDGIRIFEASSIQIGGTGMGEANVIAGNARHGIKLGANSEGSSNLISGNSIFGNGDLGIDLDRNANDPDPIPDPLDPDPNPAFANAGQNQPQICDGVNIPACGKPAYDSGTATTSFNWRLSSALNTDYVFEVFASDMPNASGSGEGQSYLGSFNASTDASGNASGSQMLTPMPSFDSRGKYLSLTVRPVNVIDPPGPLMSGPANNSSEFSNAVKVPVPGTLQFSMLNYSVAEAGATATISVTRSGGSDDPVGVSFATSDGSATEPSDYAMASNTLSWADGDAANKTFDISINNDGSDEIDETVDLLLSNPTGGATLGSPTMATLTIIDDDAPAVLSINDLAIAEGASGMTAFSFTVSLSPASGKSVSVSAASADGTATLADNDYVQLMPTMIDFAPGQTSMQVVVMVNGDMSPEGNEDFSVSLSGAVNATIGDAQGVGTIIDDEQATVTVDDVSVAEGNAGTSTLSFTLTRSDATGMAAVDVQSADGTATLADNDYVALPLTTVNFGNGVASVPVTVTVNADGVFETDETVLLNLSNPLNLSIGDAQGVGTINNDDAQPTIAIDDVDQVEGQAGMSAFSFTISLSNPSSQSISVSAASADGTATLADNDYVQLMPTMIDFAPGQTSMPVVVMVNGDTSPEGNEDFFANLSGAVNATIGDAQGVGTIIDDEQATVTIDDVSVAEGNAGTSTLSFTLTRSDATGMASVDVQSADGTATLADNDYVALPLTTVNFGNGVASVPVTVTVNADGVFETDETVLLNLSNPLNLSIGDAQGVGTIGNDDAQPSISISDISLAEGNAGTTVFNFEINLSNSSSQLISVSVASADGSATLAGNDYLALAATLVTFLPGDLIENVSVSVNGDVQVEGNESFFVNLSGAVNASIGDPQGIGTIGNDDAPTTAFSGPTATGTGPFTATLSGGGSTCSLTTASGLIGAPPGSGAIPSTLPTPDVVFLHGMFVLAIEACTVGSTVNLSYTYPAPLPDGSVFWKYGRTLANSNPHWYQVPAVINGATVTFSVTDGGLGDDDLLQNGNISDPAGVATPLAIAQAPLPIPALGSGMLLLMLLMIGGLGSAQLATFRVHGLRFKDGG